MNKREITCGSIVIGIRKKTDSDGGRDFNSFLFIKNLGKQALSKYSVGKQYAALNSNIKKSSFPNFLFISK